MEIRNDQNRIFQHFGQRQLRFMRESLARMLTKDFQVCTEAMPRKVERPVCCVCA